MELRPGDVIAGRYELVELVAVQDERGEYRCPKCGEPCGMMGHRSCTKSDQRAES